jgi:hypothetical protein
MASNANRSLGGKGRSAVLSENSLYLSHCHCIALVCGTFLCFKFRFDGFITYNIFNV